MVLGALTIGLCEFATRGQEVELHDEGKHDLCFVNTLVSGLKVAALVDTSATHNFVSEWIATTLHRKPKSSEATFKVVNSTMRPTTRVVCFAPLKVGEWFGSLDLMVVPLDDHSVILGHDFLKLAKAVLVPHENYLMFLDRNKTCGVSMMTRRKLGQMLRMSVVNLVEIMCEPTNRHRVIAQ